MSNFFALINKLEAQRAEPVSLTWYNDKLSLWYLLSAGTKNKFDF